MREIVCFSANLLLQHRGNDQLRPHQSQVLQGLGCVQTARLTEHGQQDGLHHTLDKFCDVLLCELVAFWYGRQPRGLSVALSVQPPHHAGWETLEQLHELHLQVRTERQIRDKVDNAPVEKQRVSHKTYGDINGITQCFSTGADQNP